MKLILILFCILNLYGREENVYKPLEPTGNEIEIPVEEKYNIENKMKQAVEDKIKLNKNKEIEEIIINKEESITKEINLEENKKEYKMKETIWNNKEEIPYEIEEKTMNNKEEIKTKENVPYEMEEKIMNNEEEIKTKENVPYEMEEKIMR